MYHVWYWRSGCKNTTCHLSCTYIDFSPGWSACLYFLYALDCSESFFFFFFLNETNYCWLKHTLLGTLKLFCFKETWQFQVVQIIFEVLFNPHFVCQTFSNTIAEFRCCRLNTFNLFPCFSHLSSLSPHSSSTPNKTYLPLFCDKISGLKCTDSVC